MKGDKTGALELSIGTIVVIVLAMSMLILGLVLIKTIFKGATSITDMTNSQLKQQVSKLFGEDKRLVVLPVTQHINIKAGETSGFWINIKNLLRGVQSGKFSYDVEVSDSKIGSKCGVNERTADGWMTTGGSMENIGIPSGKFVSEKVLLTIPEGTALCTFRYGINVNYNGKVYDSAFIDVTITA